MPDTLAGRRVLVTRGCGFIGSHLVARLVAEGAERVTVLDAAEPGPRLGTLRERIDFVRHELGRDGAPLEPHLTGVDTVFHLAARKHNTSRDAPREVLVSNVDGTWDLAAAAARAGVRRVVFASSLYACGRTGLPAMTEDEAPRPETVYGVSKLAGERLLACLRRETGLDCVSLRYFFVYGPEQHAGSGYPSVIVRNFERLRRGERPTVYGDGRQALDYVYVGDVIDATLLAAGHPAAAGELFNVGSGRAVSVLELTDRMIEVSGQRTTPLPSPPDWTAGTCRVASVERIRERLGWRPRVELAEGLARTWADLERRG